MFTVDKLSHVLIYIYFVLQDHHGPIKKQVLCLYGSDLRRFSFAVDKTVQELMLLSHNSQHNNAYPLDICCFAIEQSTHICSCRYKDFLQKLNLHLTMGCGTSTQGSPRTKHVSGGEMSATEKCEYELFILFAYIEPDLCKSCQPTYDTGCIVLLEILQTYVLPPPHPRKIEIYFQKYCRPTSKLHESKVDRL